LKLKSKDFFQIRNGTVLAFHLYNYYLKVQELIYAKIFNTLPYLISKGKIIGRVVGGGGVIKRVYVAV